MKRNVLLLFVLLLITMTVRAQFHITPEVGVSMFKTDYSTSDNGKAIVSPCIGIGVDYSFKEDAGWGLSSGLYFYQKRDAGESSGIWFGENGYWPLDWKGNIGSKVNVDEITKIDGFENDSQRSYLQLPVLVTYTWKLAQNTGLSLGVGPYVALGIAGKHKVKGQTYDMETGEFSYSEKENSPFEFNYKRFEVGLSTMISLEVNHWVTKVNYETNLNRRDRYKDNLISLGIGYRFSL